MTDLREKDPEMYKKAEEFSYNSIQISQPAYVGEVGARFIYKSFEKYNMFPSTGAWGNYDSLYHLAYGLDFAIN